MKLSRLSLALLIVVPAAASAQQIATRADLNAILGGGGTTETFENFNTGGSPTLLGVTTLDSNSVTNGQGPGLVQPGASYSVDTSRGGYSSFLQWNPNGYFGLNTQTLLSNMKGEDIHYTVPVNAMGIDLAAYNGYGDIADVQVFNGASMIGEVGVGIPDANAHFFGWQNAGGITDVKIYSTYNGWSPLMDNHTYGAVPEPMSILALGGGLVAIIRRRRK